MTFNYTHNQLVKLMDSFKDINKIHDITGVLLYSDGNVIQFFEGPIEKTKQLYDNILNDTRHTKIIKMLHQKIESRNLPEWYMMNNMSEQWDNLNFLETLSIDNFKIKLLLDTFKKTCKCRIKINC